jgi:upstream activation factor subunit UAF30
MARFDKFHYERNGGPNPEPSEPVPTVEGHTNGTKANGADTSEDASVSLSTKRSPEDDSALSELDDSPPKKKLKKPKTGEDADAAYAKKLQEEFNAASRARSTRGGNTKKRAPATKKGEKRKKKSSNRVKDEDDSELESGSGGEKKEPKRTGGFHVCLPSFL